MPECPDSEKVCLFCFKGTRRYRRIRSRELIS